MNRFAVALLAVSALTACSSPEDKPADPSVQVTAIQPHRGSVTAWLTAYGSATPSTSGAQTLSIPQAGQVTQLVVTPGAAVHAGQALVVFTVAPSAHSAFEAAATTLSSARRQRDTTAQLLAQQLATRDQLSQAEKALTDARATVDAMRREGAGAAVQTIRAPFDGIVTAIPVAQGDRPAAGAPLITVARKGGIVVTVGIDPGARAHVHAGAAARLGRLSGGEAIAGHVLRIDGQLNATTHLVDVDVSFPAGAILVGEALRVEIAIGQNEGWIVPHAAVVTGEEGMHVFQIMAGKAKAVPVDVVQAGDRQDVVSGAIDARRAIVVDGAYQVEDGGAVRRAAGQAAE